MKMMRKYIALLICTIMIISMGIVTSAAELGTGGIVEPAAGDSELKIKKTIRMENSEAGTYAQPDIDYEYKIEPIDPPSGAKIGDITVKKGVAGGVLIKSDSEKSDEGKVSFLSHNTYTTGASGSIKYQDVTKYLTLTTDVSKFTVPGIYRYHIFDKTRVEALVKAGIIRKDVDDGYATGANKVQDVDRYLDVYIENDDAGTGFKVGAYVLFSANTVDDSKKSEGFINTDKYRTYNVKISKLIDGNLADKTHEFPFTLDVINMDGNNRNNHTYYVGKGTDTPVASTGTETTFKLKNNEYYYIKGLTPFASVKFSENNDTSDIYEISASGYVTPGDESTKKEVVAETKANGGDDVAMADYKAVSTYNASATVVPAKEADVTEMGDVVWKNYAQAVSPTDIVRRYLPYIAILLVAIMLIIVSMLLSRRRDEDI